MIFVREIKYFELYSLQSIKQGSAVNLRVEVNYV
jgi:hypothetical protein